MPCKETSSIIKVVLDTDECLKDFSFQKITCSKVVGGGIGFKEFCIGRPIAELEYLQFDEVIDQLGLQGTEDQFLLFLSF